MPAMDYFELRWNDDKVEIVGQAMYLGGPPRILKVVEKTRTHFVVKIPRRPARPGPMSAEAIPTRFAVFEFLRDGAGEYEPQKWARQIIDFPVRS